MTNENSSDLSQRDSAWELWFIFVGLLLVSFVYRTELLAFSSAKWATVSAWILMATGVAIAQRVEGRFEQMLQRLVNRRAVSLSQTDFAEFRSKLRLDAKRSGFFGSLAIPALLLVGYGLTMKSVDSLTIGEIIVEMMCACIVGRHAGRCVFHGFLGKRLAAENVRVNMILGHSDQAAGLRPIGDFYFLQAIIAALPVVFFAFWVVILPMWMVTWPESDPDFVKWKGAYLAFLFVALGFELTTFVLPMLFFHRQMNDQKRQLLPLADQLSAELAHVQLKRIAKTTTQRTPNVEVPVYAEGDGTDPGQLIEQIALLENLPTWPVAPQIRNRFAAGNLALLAPGAMEVTRKLMDAISNGIH